MIEVSIQCPCGQTFEFDVKPVENRMPCAVACPQCGRDSTEAANEQLQSQPPPPVPSDKTNLIVLGLSVAIAVVVGLFATAFYVLNRQQTAAAPASSATAIEQPKMEQPLAPLTNAAPIVSNMQAAALAPVASSNTSALTEPLVPEQPAPSSKTQQRDPSLVGIGALFDSDLKKHRVEITKVLANSPAAEAGLVPKLIVSKIDGIVVKDKELKAVADMIFGPVGSTITFDVVNPKTHEPSHVEIVRRKYR